MGVADWVPKGRWVCFTRKDGLWTRAIRRSRLSVRVYKADKGKAPLIRHYDGTIVGLDMEAPRGGELRVVIRERWAEAPRGIAASAGALLTTMLRDAFTHPGISDVANAAAVKLGRRARTLSR